jgi:hypothetical protein
MTMHRMNATVALLAAFLVAWPVHTRAQSASAVTLKAAFLYNFAKFTEWPETALPAGQRLSLCVVGDAAVADALEHTIKGRAHDGHELTVQVMKTDGPLRSCHLLYVDGRDAAKFSEVLDVVKTAPVFTVADHGDFTGKGGIAQLILESDRMRFAINVSAAERARLHLSSKLLSLAKIVRDRP